MEKTIELLKNFVEKDIKLSQQELNTILSELNNYPHLKVYFLNILSHPKATSMIESPEKIQSYLEQNISNIFNIKELEKLNPYEFAKFLYNYNLDEKTINSFTNSPHKEIALIISELKKNNFNTVVEQISQNLSMLNYVGDIILEDLKRGNTEEKLINILRKNAEMYFSRDKIGSLVDFLVKSDLRENVLKILSELFFNYRIVRNFLRKHKSINEIASLYINYLNELIKGGHWNAINELIDEIINIGDNTLIEEIRKWINENKSTLENHLTKAL